MSALFTALALTLSAQAVTVTSLTDTVPSVAGELRHALDNQVGPGTIDFQGAGTIVLSAPLPVIDGSLGGLVLDGGGDIVIDASNTTGHALVIDNTTDVAIHGLTVRQADGYGVAVSGSSNITIGGTAAQANAFIGHSEAGIHVAGSASTVTIARNRVGLSLSNAAGGNCDAPVGPCAGIVVEQGAAGVALDYNVVGANLGHGVAVYASGTTLFGNRVGTDTTGQVDQGNTGDGVLVSGTSAQPTSGVDIDGNIVVGNGGHGVHLAAWSDSATVTGNYVGLTSSHALLGNDGDGVHLAGGADHAVGGALVAEGNRIGANGGHGIAASATTLDAGLVRLDVRHNLVGVDDTTATDRGNGGYGVLLSLPIDPLALPADQHTLGATGAGNTLSGNDLGGAFLAAANVSFEGNLVGTDAAGLVAVPNGTAGLPPLIGLPESAGVRVVVSYGVDTAPVQLTDNRISGNHGAGIWASRAPGSTGVVARPVDLVDNHVGVTAGLPAGPLGNGDHGIVVLSLDDVLVVGNEVAYNVGDGVRVGIGLTRASALRVEVDDNEVHHNEGAGVALTSTPVLGVVSAPNLDGYVHDNLLEANGGPGIHLTGGATQHELSHNTITGNDQCAILDEGASDTSLLVEAPIAYAVDLVAGTITGRVDVLNGTPDRLELYERATGLPFADLAGSAIDADGRWDYTGAIPAAVLTADDVSGLVVLTSGTTSEMTRYEGDGCTPAQCTPVGEEGNGCTVYWLDPGVGCLSVDRPVGYRCDDGDELTGMINHRIDPTETTLYQDACDGAGTCVAGTDLTATYGAGNEGEACPWKTDCNDAEVRPEGCTYNAVDSNLTCGVDALFCDGLCGGLGVCSNCYASALLPDDNLNAVPDAWELGDFDFDCDGTVDAGSQIGEGAVGFPLDLTLPPIYVFVAYMDMALNVDEYGNPLHAGSVHSHHLDAAMLADIELQFEDRDVDLIVEQVAIPHYTMVSDVRQSWDPDCNDVYDFATLDDLKARYFPPHKRGSYHFVLIAHGDATPRLEVDAIDGTCVRKGQSFAGKGEGKGGDDARVSAHAGWESDPLVEPDHGLDTKLFAHELGHTLDLHHGGGGNADNQAPNIQSVMNYRYQNVLRLVSAGGYHFDYSPEQVSLNENSLDESVGFASTLPVAEHMKLTWDCPPGSGLTGLGAPNQALNWNCTGSNTEVGIPADISGRDGETNLESRDEWDDLHFPMACNLSGRRDWVDAGDEEFGEVDRFRDGPSAWREVDIDVAPACPGDHVPLDDTHPIDVVVTGDATWSAADLLAFRTRMAGGAPTHTTIADLDADGIDDLRFRFRPTDLFLMGPGEQDLVFNAHLSDGTALYAEGHADAAQQADGDADGIIDPCDLCPHTLANTPVGDDGC